MYNDRDDDADGDDQKKAHLSVGASSEVSLKVTEADISNLTASIRSPSGLEEPCVLKRLANGHLGITTVVCLVFVFISFFSQLKSQMSCCPGVSSKLFTNFSKYGYYALVTRFLL